MLWISDSQIRRRSCISYITYNIRDYIVEIALINFKNFFGFYLPRSRKNFVAYVQTASCSSYKSVLLVNQCSCFVNLRYHKKKRKKSPQSAQSAFWRDRCYSWYTYTNRRVSLFSYQNALNCTRWWQPQFFYVIFKPCLSQAGKIQICIVNNMLNFYLFLAPKVECWKAKYSAQTFFLTLFSSRFRNLQGFFWLFYRKDLWSGHSYICVHHRVNISKNYSWGQRQWTPLPIFYISYLNFTTLSIVSSWPWC